MKVRITTVIRYLLFIYMFFSVGLSKIFTNSFLSDKRVVTHFTFMIAILMFVLYLMLNKKSGTKYTKFLNSFVISFLIFEWFYTYYRYHVSFSDFFFSNERFIYLVLACCVLHLLCKGSLTVEQLFVWVCRFSLVSYGIRFIISVYYSAKGVVLFPTLATEFASENWIRNDVLRVNPPAFYMLIIPICLWLFFNSKKRKFIAIVTGGVTCVYFLAIWQSRAAIVYSAIVFMLIVLIKRQTATRKVLLILLLLAVLGTMYVSGAFDGLLASFSVTNQAMGHSTRFRLIALDYYYLWWKQNPILGIGGLSEEMLVKDLLKGHISDIGFIANIFRFGIWGAVLFFSIIGRWFFVIKKLSKRKDDNTIFAIGIAISYILYSINIDWFYGSSKYAIPIAIAVMEYYYHEIRYE